MGCGTSSELALVTGGGGFLGGAIVRQLVERGRRVRSFSRKDYPGLRALGVEQLGGDLADYSAVYDACKGCSLVYHVAAKAEIWGDYAEFYGTNVSGTRNVLRACLELGIDRLIYTSSPSVIFDGKDKEGVNETVPYSPSYKAHYPATKAVAEQEVLAANEDRLATVALRPHLICGPGDTNLIPKILEKGRTGRLRKLGAGDKLVDFTYVEDAAEAHLLAADRLFPGSSVGGKVYFISQGEPVYLWEFIGSLFEASGLPPLRGAVPSSVGYALAALAEAAYRTLRLRGDPPMTRFLVEALTTAHWFDISAARRDLDYRPRIGMQEVLRRIEGWLRRNSTLQ